MREIEFLPDWYPQARRRQAILRLHVATGLLVLELADPEDRDLDPADPVARRPVLEDLGRAERVLLFLLERVAGLEPQRLVVDAFLLLLLVQGFFRR